MGCEALTEFKIATIDQPAQDILYSIEVMFPCLCPCGFCPCVARAGLGGSRVFFFLQRTQGSLVVGCVG